MGHLDRQFAEPHNWWDAYTERKDAEYAALIAGKTCLDCGKCVRSERHPDEGFCTEDKEFRTEDDRPLELGMECFAA